MYAIRSYYADDGCGLECGAVIRDDERGAATVLRAEGVRRTYAIGDSAVRALDGVDLALAAGELGTGHAGGGPA